MRLALIVEGKSESDQFEIYHSSQSGHLIALEPEFFWLAL
jgi:hypothetical protein